METPKDRPLDFIFQSRKAVVAGARDLGRWMLGPSLSVRGHPALVPLYPPIGGRIFQVPEKF